MILGRRDYLISSIICEQLREQAQHIDPEILQSLLKAKTPSPLLKEFINLHERLGHMPFVVMFRLCSIECLNPKCLVLQEEIVPVLRVYIHKLSVRSGIMGSKLLELSVKRIISTPVMVQYVTR